MRRFLSAAIAGMVATCAHTVVMQTLHSRLPLTRHRPVPPLEITAAAARRVDGANSHRLPLRTASVLAHVGYGAATGSAYAPLGDRAHPHPLLAGVGYGLFVWAVSYQGWIPAMRLLEPATRQSWQRNITMILAHVAWGATLGYVYNRGQRATIQRR